MSGTTDRFHRMNTRIEVEMPTSAAVIDCAPIARAHLSGPVDPYAFHVAQYKNESASVEHRNASGQWLIDHGFIGVDGKMILTDRKVAR